MQLGICFQFGCSAGLPTRIFDSNVLTLADFMAGYVYQSTIVRGDQERQVKLNSFTCLPRTPGSTTRKLNFELWTALRIRGAASHDNNQDLSVFNPTKGGLVVVGHQHR